jgi:quercetin dioxygenase-like cupin family protein
MNRWMRFSLAFVVLVISLHAMAQEHGVIKPQLLLREIVQGMPKGEKQEVRVLRANFQPGDRTLFHTHRFPVTVCVLEGAFTLEMEGRESQSIAHRSVIEIEPNLTSACRSRAAAEVRR